MKIAEIIRDLQRRNSTDTMTFSGRQLYLRALERLAQEYAVIHKIPLDAAEDKIEDILDIPKDLELVAPIEESTEAEPNV